MNMLTSVNVFFFNEFTKNRYILTVQSLTEVCLHQENASREHPTVHGLHHQAPAGHRDPVVWGLQSVPPPAHHRDQVWDDQADRHRTTDRPGHGVSPSTAACELMHAVTHNALCFCPQLPARQVHHPQRSEEQQYPFCLLRVGLSDGGNVLQWKHLLDLIASQISSYMKTWPWKLETLAWPRSNRAGAVPTSLNSCLVPSFGWLVTTFSPARLLVTCTHGGRGGWPVRGVFGT